MDKWIKLLLQLAMSLVLVALGIGKMASVDGGFSWAGWFCTAIGLAWAYNTIEDAFLRLTGWWLRWR